LHRNAAQQLQHRTDREFGLGVRARGHWPHDLDTGARERLGIQVLHADTEPPDGSQQRREMQRLGIQLPTAERSVHAEQRLAQHADRVQVRRKTHGMARADPLQDLGFQRLDDQNIHVTCGSAPARHAIPCVPQ
jgi:hypothetical protein